ncbi:L,D-transpeptidase [Bacillus nakamurai]|uniref:L,D-transpeptidase n=1 Tax=Bacillus nakamurai TaxID=1793963 RepID=UPI00398E51F8
MKKSRSMLLLLFILLLPVSIMAGCAQSGSGTAQASAEPKKPETKSSQVETKETDWTKPTGGTYPDIKKKPVWIDVSTEKQRAYIKEGSKTLYTMVISSGLDRSDDESTPKGTFYIQPERGKWFFSLGYKEGAEYWVSWKNHGEFLFHSVPMTENKKVIEKEAKKLGTKASHGCIRLAIPDAKWIYENIPVKTKVVIS